MDEFIKATQDRCQSLWKFLWVVPRTDPKFDDVMKEVEISILEEAEMLSKLNNFSELISYNILKEITNSKMNIAAYTILGFSDLTKDQTDTIAYAVELARLGKSLHDANISIKIMYSIIDTGDFCNIEHAFEDVINRCSTISNTIERFFKPG